MRTDLVGRARGPIPNRFLLALVAMRITAKFGVHRDLRVQERINITFERVAQGTYVIWPDHEISGFVALDWGTAEVNDAPQK